MKNIQQIKQAEKRLNAAFNSILCILFIIVILYSLQYCEVNSILAQDPTALRLVQCIRAECDECDKNPDEPAAIAHVIKKRMIVYNNNPRQVAKQMAYHEYILSYCAVFDKRSKQYYRKRGKAIRASTFERPLHGSFVWWLRMRSWADRFIAGKISDPEPQAEHYGGDMDTARALKMGWCRTSKPGKYANTFWRICK